MPKYDYKPAMKGERRRVGGTVDDAPRGKGNRGRGPRNWSIGEDTLYCAGLVGSGILIMVALMTDETLALHNLFGAMGSGFLMGMGALIALVSG